MLFRNLGVRDDALRERRSALVLGLKSVEMKARVSQKMRTQLPTWLGAFANGGQKAAERELFWLSGFFACEDTNFDFCRVS